MISHDRQTNRASTPKQLSRTRGTTSNDVNAHAEAWRLVGGTPLLVARTGGRRVRHPGGGGPFNSGLELRLPGSASHGRPWDYLLPEGWTSNTPASTDDALPKGTSKSLLPCHGNLYPSTRIQ